MTRERMLEVYRDSLNQLSDDLDMYGYGKFSTFCDSADWGIEVDVSMVRVKDSIMDILLARVKGGYSTDNAFTEDLVDLKIYEGVGVRSLYEEAVPDLIFNALKLTKCPLM